MNYFEEVSVRAANEGVPVAAIARIVQASFDDVSTTLRDALACGRIGEMPKPDWPPGQRWGERSPSVPVTISPEDTEFALKREFGLTRLEAAFLGVLVRYEHVDKEKLHAVIEEQRSKRSLRPDKPEATDPKMVDVIVCKLRKKLKEKDPKYVLHTSWGSGYYFDPGIRQAIQEKVRVI